MRCLPLFALLVGMSACVQGADASELPKAQAPDGFWDHWGDGRAELNGYRLRQSRYGQLRDGTATLVFVTETFTHGQRVKSDGGHDDEYPVMKLNEVRDYQTGIYDYNVMTSSFLRLDGQTSLGQPVKVSMSMQEWCGHVYEQLLPVDGRLTWHGHSYFDGEADAEQSLELPEHGLLLDSLPIVVRGLAGELVAPGETVEVPALPPLTHGRYAHTEPSWTTAKLSRSDTTASVEVPAGTFDTYTVTAEVQGMPTTTYWVEADAPHRLVKWSRSDGELGELLGSERAPYWRQNREGDESELGGLGLVVP